MESRWYWLGGSSTTQAVFQYIYILSFLSTNLFSIYHSVSCQQCAFTSQPSQPSVTDPPTLLKSTFLLYKLGLWQEENEVSLLSFLWQAQKQLNWSRLGIRNCPQSRYIIYIHCQKEIHYNLNLPYVGLFSLVSIDRIVYFFNLNSKTFYILNFQEFFFHS